MEKILPILSRSLRDILNQVVDTYDDCIAKWICKIDDMVEAQDGSFYFRPDEIQPYLKNEVRMLAGRHGEEFEISYLPYGRTPEYVGDGIWARKNRQTGKPAKIFQKLIAKEYAQRTWEIFNNRLRACMCRCENFQIVEGEDIRYWYLDDHYYRLDGTLGNSCMKYDHAQRFFDLYVDNAKMLITTKDNKLTGRAIIWEINGKTLMDRVYTCFDYLENCFIEYAKERKWWIRETQGLLDTGNNQYWFSPDDNYTNAVSPEFRIPVKEYGYWPYVDSFRYYDMDCGAISTHCFECAGTLDSTEGYVNDSAEEFYCANCGRISYGYDGELPDGMYYSEWYDRYYCANCCYYNDYEGDYYPNSDPEVKLYEGSSSILIPESRIEDAFEFNGEYYCNDDYRLVTNSTTGESEVVEK